MNESQRNTGKGDISSLKRKIKTAVDKKTLLRNKKELISYFEKRTSKLKIVKTTRTPGGQILDWIDINSQVRNGKIASPPPLEMIKAPAGRMKDTLSVFELEKKGIAKGPEGTVPVLRKDVRKINYSKSLKSYLSKYERETRSVFKGNEHVIEVPGDGAHDYANTYQYVTCYGGEFACSAFDPYTQYSNEFSLLQIALVRGSGNSRQTLEAGWQAYKDLYGDWQPHLFVYYTTNNYTSSGDNKGGYNRDVDGWVQYSSSIYPGATFTPYSVRGGSQRFMQFKYQLYQGNWWLKVNNQWIGYYPASLYSTSGLRSKADKIAFYGEIVDSANHAGLTRTDMGSGYWPEYRWKWAAYMRNLKYQSSTGGSMSNYNGTSNASDPGQYDLETHMNSGSTWGSYMWLGGPGA
ncbi:MAG: neprosin family prolyl endopeptidase [Bacteroidetes bacterium]|nr:neprosin family prolyl endopeptidase [Bacteroidota bacterium]